VTKKKPEISSVLYVPGMEPVDLGPPGDIKEGETITVIIKPKKPRKKKPKPYVPRKWSERHEQFLALTDQMCKYPIIEEEYKPPFTFCTKKVLPGSSYCPEHYKICCPARYTVRWYK
jgi:hypothetical protein